MAPKAQTQQDVIAEKKFDAQIEDDIRSLRRSSQLFAILGLCAVVLLTVVILVSIYDDKTMTEIQFVGIGFVETETAQLLNRPAADAHAIKTLKQGEGVFILARIDGWIQVQKNGDEGWVREAEIKSKDEAFKEARGSSESPIEIREVSWVVDELNNYTIVGRVRNVTTLPIKNVKISVLFYDENHKLAGTKSTLVSPTVPLKKDEDYPFNITGLNEANFKMADYRVETWQ